MNNTMQEKLERLCEWLTKNHERFMDGKYEDYSATENEYGEIEIAAHYYVEEWNGEDEDKSLRDEWDFLTLDSRSFLREVYTCIYGYDLPTAHITLDSDEEILDDILRLIDRL